MLIFRLIRHLLRRFTLLELYEKTEGLKGELFKILSDLQSRVERAHDIICCFPPDPSLQSLISPNWNRYLPSAEIWGLIGDRISVERLSSPEFASELYAILDPIPVPVPMILESEDNYLIKTSSQIQSLERRLRHRSAVCCCQIELTSLCLRGHFALRLN
jgi:hypothetical protein